MRFRAQEYTGKGVTVAILDSGIDPQDARFKGADISGWNIQLSATSHALIGSRFQDDNGHGTDMAAAVHHTAPDARILAVKILDSRLRTNADLMIAGIETAFRNGAQIINLSLGTPNMGRAALLRDVCAMAAEAGSLVIAATHPGGERAYPADLPETVGVATHPDCPIDKFYYFAPHRFPRAQWGNLTGKFLTHGYERRGDTPGRFRGSGIATAYLAGRFACLREAIPDDTVDGLMEVGRQLALTPVPEIGYA